MELCQNVDNAVVLARRGEIRSPENCLLCVFGQATPAPTSDNWIARLSFDTLPSHSQLRITSHSIGKWISSVTDSIHFPIFLLNLIDAIYNFPLVVHIYVQVHAYVRVARYIRTCRLTHTYVWPDAYVHILQIGSLHCMLQKDLEDF